MKKRNTLVIGLSVATAGLLLAGCDNSGVPGKKDVQVKPPAAAPIQSPAAKFKGSFGASDKGGKAGDAPAAEGEKKE